MEEGKNSKPFEYVVLSGGEESDEELEGGGDALPSRPFGGDEETAEYVFVRSASAPRARVGVAWSSEVKQSDHGLTTPTGGARHHTPTRSRTPTYRTVRGRVVMAVTPPPMRPGRKKLGRRKQRRRDNALLLGHNQFREEMSQLALIS